jgi:hypothetical protein
MDFDNKTWQEDSAAFFDQPASLGREDTRERLDQIPSTAQEPLHEFIELFRLVQHYEVP